MSGNSDAEPRRKVREIEAKPKLLDWLNGMNKATQDLVAERMDTSTGQLRQIGRGKRSCSARLAVEIDKYSEGKVSMTYLCPEINWDHVRLFIHAR